MRCVVGSWALLQLAVLPALSVIDGLFALRSGSVAVAHIEGQSSKSCQPPHSEDCALCQSLSSHVANTQDPPAIEWARVGRHRNSIDRARDCGQSVALDLAYSRAPPIA